MKKFSSFRLIVCCVCAYLAVCGVVCAVSNNSSFAANKQFPSCISSAQIVRAAQNYADHKTSAFSTTAQAAFETTNVYASEKLEEQQNDVGSFFKGNNSSVASGSFSLANVAKIAVGQSSPKQADDTCAFSTTAQAAAVVERSTGRVLFEKNSHQSLPMASTTKIVTALTVLNNCQNLQQVVQIPAEACGIEGSSVYLRAGERLTVCELLYGLMLRSGNDCAVALALTVGGTVPHFAEMMNQTATSLGCTESNFVTPHGLHHNNHYTSVSDLAKITCAALANPVFRQIVSTKSVKISNEGMEYNRLLVNKNKLLSSYDGADGVKTGYTKKAGRCFVGSATKNGMQVVVVVLNCAPMFEETAQMLDVAFENYRLERVILQNKLCGVVYKRGKPTYYVAPEPFSYPLKKGEKTQTKITLDDECQKIEVFLNGNCVYRAPLTVWE